MPFENDGVVIWKHFALDNVAIQEFSIATRIARRHRMTPVHFCRFEHPTVLHVGLRARWPVLEGDSTLTSSKRASRGLGHLYGSTGLSHEEQ